VQRQQAGRLDVGQRLLVVATLESMDRVDLRYAVLLVASCRPSHRFVVVTLVRH
jgi:hypothetical protein